MDGRVFGRGATQQAGGPHAEVMALREARASGHDLRGHVAWVTLEPCAHHGRTPPCCDALIEAGLTRVVVALGDPFPAVNGAGVTRMRAAGIEVVMADPDLMAAARDINIGFFSRVQRARPWVRMKVATSLDGVTALHNGCSQWITGEEARQDGHAWRRRASAVLTGIGTVLADDPRLDVRWVPTAAQPTRVVVDSRFRTPPTARLLAPPGAVYIYGAVEPGQGAASLVGTGAILRTLADGSGRVDLGALLRDLASRGCNELHVEAGAALNGALLTGGWVDELLLYAAPLLLGPGRPIAHLPGLERLERATSLQFKDFALVGKDLRIRALTQSGLAGWA
jgi:diaminohydroxyphosphoribosylaminopyrimidine deaminase/5-amino-6-(5-phosphoribosylamino)uracil reductase